MVRTTADKTTDITVRCIIPTATLVAGRIYTAARVKFYRWGGQNREVDKVLINGHWICGFRFTNAPSPAEGMEFFL